MIRALVVLGGLLLAFSAMAQQSSSYKLTEHTFNAGGRPLDGVVVTSPNYRVTLDALGDALVGLGLSSPNFNMDASYGASYPPPGEVLALRFTDPVTLVWDPERSVGDYNLYRDLLSNLLGLGYGNCLLQAIAVETATDAAVPPADDGYFYLVTAENRLDEEGIKGRDSAGTVRPNPNPCP